MEQLSCGTHERVTVANSHRVDYTNGNRSSRSCVLYDCVHVYYMIELFNLFRYVSMVVRNFKEILKPINFNITPMPHAHTHSTICNQITLPFPQPGAHSTI